MNEELIELLPNEYKELFSENGSFAIASIDRFFNYILELIKETVVKEGSGLVPLLSLVALCGIFAAFEEASSQKNTRTILQLCFLLSGLFAVIPMIYQVFSDAELHLQELTAFVTVILPALSGVLLSMGAVNSFSLSGLSLSMLLSFLSQFVLGMLFPFLKISFTFDLFSIITANAGLSTFASKIKNVFLWLMGLSTTGILTMLAFQNVIASKADSLSLRAFRFTAAGVVPIVGQTIAESSKTLLSSLDMLRSSIGVLGVGVILLMLLPELLSLLFKKIIFDIAASMSDACGSKILFSVFHCASSVIGGIIALVSLADLLFALSFSMLSFFTVS